MLRKKLLVSLPELDEDPYVSILCYPKPDAAEARRRLKELERLRVVAFEFTGEKQVLGLPVLGKGCVGIVVLAHRRTDEVALKIRRVDADRPRMQREAKLLQKANSVEVGPMLLGVSKNFLLSQFVKGFLLPEWLDKTEEEQQLRKTLHQLLEQCWRLDSAGLDHGELSYAPKHVIIDYENKPFIVDFETASVNRRPSNVTSICQFLFLGSDTARRISDRLQGVNRSAMIEALRGYKMDRTRGDFERLLDVCGF